jgi:hypothetical protein
VTSSIAHRKRVAIAVLLVVAAALGVTALTRLDAPSGSTPRLASPSAYNYDTALATATMSPNLRAGAFRRYDRSTQPARLGTAAIPARLAAEGVAVGIDENAAGHIFKDAAGHLAEDTPANRELLTSTASRAENYLGTDKYGNEWYARTRADGTQVWVRVQNGAIRSGGVNPSPGTWNPQTALKRP